MCVNVEVSKLIKKLRPLLFLRYFNIICQVNALIVILLFAGIYLPNPSRAQKKVTIRKVVLDPGHGGHDPGAIGKRGKEKNINLAIALKLGNMIQRNMKDVKVIYTRDKDYFVELDRRTQIANDAKADLFISIHCNANNSKSLRGAETYVMGLHRSQANLEIAKLENASILLESDYSTRYEGFDPNSDESYITFSLFQNANLDQSMAFAAEIQEQLGQRVGLNDRGVRQAGFLVLYKTTMPSVLVEVGYLSNAQEEVFLISDKGQEYIATAIFRALKNFSERSESPHQATDPKPAASETTTTQQPGTGTVQKPVPTKSVSSNGISWRVQIASMSTEISTTDARFKGLPKVRMYRHGGMFKYTAGDEFTDTAAQELLVQVRRKGFNDAFIVVFQDGKRITPAEARSLQATQN